MFQAAVKSSRLIPLLSTLRPSIMGVPFSRNSSSEAKSAKFVDEKIHSNCVMIFSKSTCPFCTLAKRTFQDIGANYDVVELNHHDSGNDIMRELKRRTGSHTVSGSQLSHPRVMTQQFFHLKLISTFIIKIFFWFI